MSSNNTNNTKASSVGLHMLKDMRTTTLIDESARDKALISVNKYNTGFQLVYYPHLQKKMWKTKK